MMKSSDVVIHYAKRLLRPLLKPYHKYRFKRMLRQELLTESIRRAKEDGVSEESMADYIQTLKSQYISYDEFFHQYDFPILKKKKREEFVTRAQVRFFYHDIPAEVKNIFWDKVNFLRTFAAYIHRDWIRVKDHSMDEVISFMNRYDVICKPLASCCGEGIYKIFRQSLSVDEIKRKYMEFVEGDVLLEQAISNGSGMSLIHPNSLNTIRVVTVRNVKTGNVEVFGAFLRMGRGGSAIDNAHAGGLFAQINVASGVIESEGISVDGDHFPSHPDTGFRIIGYKIPRWEEIKDLCIQVASIIPKNYITGWDVVINQNEEIEFIEGNHGPDWDVMQSPLKIGVKNRLINALGKKLG